MTSEVKPAVSVPDRPRDLPVQTKRGTVNIGDEWLDPQRATFVMEISKDSNGSRAARVAGIPESYASVQSSRWLRDARVLRAINFLFAERRRKAGADRDEVARYWLDIAEADLSELSPRWGACRHCWGVDHRRQFTDVEFREARLDHQKQMLRIGDPAKRADFDEWGGPGYNHKAEPHPECPECRGDGAPYMPRIDFRNLSIGARRVFNGFKLNRDGSIEIKFKDQMRAMENYEQLTGMIRTRRPMLKLQDLAPEEIDAMLEAALADGYIGADDVQAVVCKTINVTPDAQEEKT
jgi:phage terminase small subunit